MERATIARLAGLGLSVDGAVLTELKTSYHRENTCEKDLTDPTLQGQKYAIFLYQKLI